MPELKPGWRMVKFGDVVRQVKDRADPQTSGLERFVAGEHMDTDKLKIRRWGNIGDGYLGPAFHMRFRPGQVLYGSRRTYLRKVALADFEGICANTTFVLESADPDVLLPELLPFIMQTELFHEHSERESKGSVNPYVNFSDLVWYEFALPPLEEQRRFAALLSAIHGARDANHEMQNALRPISGWLIDLLLEGQHQDLPHELAERLDVSGWRPTVLGEICALSNGNGFSPSDWSQTGMPIIRIQNVRGSSQFNYYDGVPDPKWVVQPGELLFAWAGVPGVSFGPAIWEGVPGVLNQHIYRVTPNQGVHRLWLFEILKYLTPRIERRAHGFKHSLLHIRQSEFKAQRIMLPPPSEQGILVERINQIRGWSDALLERDTALQAMSSQLVASL